MNAALQVELRERLDKSGVYFYRRDAVDGVNVSATERLEWIAVVGRIMQLTGWGVGVDESTKPTTSDIIPLHPKNDS